MQVLMSDVIPAGEFCISNKQKQLEALSVVPLHLVSLPTTDLFEYLYVMLRNVQANDYFLAIEPVFWQPE